MIFSFSSDLGNNNFDLASLKAKLIQNFALYQSVDLFHHDQMNDLESIAYQLIGGLNSFPKECIHLVFCKYVQNQTDFLIAKIKEQFIIVPNNGIMSILHSIDYSAPIYSLDYHSESFDYIQYQSKFIEGIQMILDKSYQTKLPQKQIFTQLKSFDSDLFIIGDKLITRVLFTDSLGNIVLNIQESKFREFIGQRSFYLQFYATKVYTLSTNYSKTYNKDHIGAIFNQAGYLELFIEGGNLAKLYSINKYIHVKFEIHREHEENSQINF